MLQYLIPQLFHSFFLPNQDVLGRPVLEQKFLLAVGQILSNHTHNHVIEELNLYSKLVSKGSYIVVFDTHVEDMPSDFIWEDRPWGKGNNPKTAVHEWIKNNKNFEIDNYLEHKLLLTSAPDGFLYKSS